MGFLELSSIIHGFFPERDRYCALYGAVFGAAVNFVFQIYVKPPSDQVYYITGSFCFSFCLIFVLMRYLYSFYFRKKYDINVEISREKILCIEKKILSSYNDKRIRKNVPEERYFKKILGECAQDLLYSLIEEQYKERDCPLEEGKVCVLGDDGYRTLNEKRQFSQ